METYFHKSKLGDEQLDGACIGTTFPHLFLLLHSEYAPIEVAPRAPPQVYGFKIHKDSDYFKFRYVCC
jgi:casein kinase II subunit beta